MLSFMKPSCPRTIWPGASGSRETRIGAVRLAVTAVLRCRSQRRRQAGPFHTHGRAAARGQRGTIVSPGRNRFARDARATKQTAIPTIHRTMELFVILLRQCEVPALRLLMRANHDDRIPIRLAS